MESEVDARRLDPLTYHRELAGFLKRHEPELWRWMIGGRINAESKQLRDDLLRSTYRLRKDDHPEVFAAVDRAVAALSLNVPVEVYQTEFDTTPNAGLVFVPDEAIVLLSGPLLEMLDADELAAVMGHELAHHVLWTADGGDHFVVDRLLNAAVVNGATPAFSESANRISRCTELFADRGGLLASGSLSATICALVKLTTGMRKVSAAGYLNQADEVLSRDTRPDAGISHPETFLRAVAIRDWSEGRAELSSVVDAMLHGPEDVDRLDLLAQARVDELTRAVLEDLLAPDWMQSDAVMGHARLFFPDLRPSAAVRPSLVTLPTNPSTRNYFAYVLLDFATIDPELETQSLIESAAMAYRLGITEDFARLLERELRLKPKVRNVILADAEVRSVELSAGVAGGRP